MKRLIALLLSIVMLFCLAACGNDNTPNDETNAQTNETLNSDDTTSQTEDSDDNSKIPTLKNKNTASETTIAYPVNQSKYLKLTQSDIDAEFSFLRELMQFDDKHKNTVLNAYLEMGDDNWNRLYIDGELFGITGQYVVVYNNAEGEENNGFINSFGFHWMIDNYETHSKQVMHCLKTYFGEYGSSKEFFYGGETYNQFKWYKTTDELWSVWLSLQDSSGWLEITPVADVVIEEEEKETYVKDGKFTIAAYTFKDGFEDAFDGINGHEFGIKAIVDDSKSFTDVDNYVSYKIQDKENNYRDVGMISFTKPNGKTLHISEEFSTDCWNGVNMLIERSIDVSAAVVATVFAVDPGIGYSEAFDVAQNIVDNISIYTGDVRTLKSVECNNIRYILYKQNKYHYLIVTALQ